MIQKWVHKSWILGWFWNQAVSSFTQTENFENPSNALPWTFWNCQDGAFHALGNISFHTKKIRKKPLAAKRCKSNRKKLQTPKIFHFNARRNIISSQNKARAAGRKNYQNAYESSRPNLWIPAYFRPRIHLESLSLAPSINPYSLPNNHQPPTLRQKRALSV